MQLGTGSFGNSGFNTVKLSGLRVHAELGLVLAPGATTAIIHIWGMTRDQLNQFTKAGLQYAVRNNMVTVEAGEVGGKMTTVFKGIVQESFPDFRAMPDVPLMISASTISDMQLKPVSPGSYQGSTDVGTIMGQMAQAAGLTLENAGVDVKLSNPYFSGTIWDQIKSCANAANIFVHVDRVAGVLAIFPKGGARAGAPVVVSAASGMIQYPGYQNVNVVVRTLFNPAIKFGSQIKVESELPPANGIWYVYGLDYTLSAQLPDGPWEQTITGYRPGGG
ncbi:MAG: hypothetical protein WB764_10615 [Xanthobacteraceae bacterium]